MKGYAQIAKPLIEQLKKDKFGWKSEVDEAFHLLKTAMTTMPVLAMPNFKKTFVVEKDASGHGLGAVLMQEQRPITYYNSSLDAKAQPKSIYEKVLMAIVMAVLKW